MNGPTRRLAIRTSTVLFVTLTLAIVGMTAAQAAAPTITSFLPSSGPVGTSVVITGTGFNDASVVSAVKFNATSATTFTVDSDTQITATVPTGATTGPIAVTDSEGTATSGTNFTVTVGPTITSFTPTSGPVGTSVVITGTGFTGATAVKFNGTSATTFTVDSNTQITATVPTGATTGPIAVTTPQGTGTSATNFTVTVALTRHARSVTLALRKHLVARGKVRVSDGFAACKSGVTVKVQRRRTNHSWRTVRRDTTSASGAYRVSLSDREGVYRAVAVREVLDSPDICAQAISPKRRHH